MTFAHAKPVNRFSEHTTERTLILLCQIVTYFADIKLKFNVKGTFLEYNRLVQNRSKVWIDYIRVHKGDIVQFKTNLRLNENMYHLLMCKKGCKNVYNIILNSNQPAVIDKELGIIPMKFGKSLLISKQYK